MSGASAPTLERRLVGQIRRLNRAFDLIEPGDRILVACSGGKDSWALAFLLRTYVRRLPFAVDLVAVTVDQGHPGFPADALAEAFARHGFAHHVVYQDTLSVVREKLPPGATTCPLCSRLRRGILHRVAERLGANKIALGHHGDDAIETLLLNQFFAGRIKAMPPKLPARNGHPAVVRPLLWALGEDVAAYARTLDVPIAPCNVCGSQPDQRRIWLRRLLDDLSREVPDARRSLLASLAHVDLAHLHLRDAQAAPAGSADETAHATLPLDRVLARIRGS